MAIGGVDDEEAGRDSGPSGGDVSGRVRVLSSPGNLTDKTKSLFSNYHQCANIKRSAGEKIQQQLTCGSVILVWGIIYTLLLPTDLFTSSSVFA